MADPLGVIVVGARGRMGRTVVAAVNAAPDLELCAEVDEGDDLEAGLALSAVQVMVDFTVPAAAAANARAALLHGVAPVVGTTGIEAAAVDAIAAEAARQRVGGAVIPNFAIGAVLMVRLAEVAAPYFDAVEVIEAHADTKLDAPSGTALHTARRIAAARTGSFTRREPEKVTLDGTRGGSQQGVGVHSLRLPGVVAEQEVVFGVLGQTLSICHRTTSREAFMPGVVATVRAVAATGRFYRSLDEVLGLDGGGGAS
ncbi:MAG: 4-hydroxy-tetrahydrodipicolinate reductase [Candidatus Dormibacteria bacterium]